MSQSHCLFTSRLGQHLSSLHALNPAILCSTQERLQREEQRFQKWHNDNIRRRHNFIPFVFNLLRIMAEEGRLQPLIEKGRIATENTHEAA